MYFKTIPNDNFSIGLLGSCLLKEIPPVNILSLYFTGSDHVQTLGECLEIIENKRRELWNPYNHTYMCLELSYTDHPDIETIINNTNLIADSFNTSYDDDLFIIALVYTDAYNYIHPLILFSDIEQSQPESTDMYIT